jgi:RNA polymerase sigma-70 factor (ECF subfamily)
MSLIRNQGVHTTSLSLLERLREPEQTQAWDRFVELYTPLLLYWARRAGLQPQDASDLVQETFTTLVEKLPQFRYDERGNFRGWLRTIVMNKWRNRVRDRRHAAARACSENLPECVEADELESLWEQEHREHLVKRALELMQTDFEPTTWKACWELSANGRPAADVAAELGITENAAYLAKWRVLRRLRQELAGLLD